MRVPLAKASNQSGVIPLLKKKSTPGRHWTPGGRESARITGNAADSMFRRSGLFLFRPDGAFVAARLGELETSAAGERKDILGDLSAKLDHFVADRFQVGMVENDQDPADFG